MNAMLRALGWLVALWLLAAGAEAKAQTATYLYCFEYVLNFTDGPTGLLSGATYPARYAKLRMIRESTGALTDYDLDVNGCKSLTLATAAWTIKVQRKAVINGNTIEVKQDGTNALYVGTVTTGFVPTNGGSNTWAVGPGPVVRIMAAATYAQYNRTGGISGETWSFRDGITDCTGTPKGCWKPGTGTINIGETLDEHKFGIIHELGHAMSDQANGYDGFSKNYDADLDDCANGDPGDANHKMPSKEHNSAAAVEGIAHFYSAAVFNARGGVGTPCIIEKQTVPDWNNTGSVDGGESVIFGCETTITETTPDIPGGDFFGATCTDGELDNRGTEFDWLRLWWDLYTDEDRLVEALFLQWNIANPDTWNADGDGTGNTYPSSRMQDALSSLDPMLDFEAEYATWAAYNGTDR